MKQTQDKWVFNFEENQLETQDGKVITVIDEHHGSLEHINLIASAPEMLEMLKQCVFAFDKYENNKMIINYHSHDGNAKIKKLISKAGGE